MALTPPKMTSSLTRLRGMRCRDPRIDSFHLNRPARASTGLRQVFVDPITHFFVAFCWRDCQNEMRQREGQVVHSDGPGLRGILFPRRAAGRVARVVRPVSRAGSRLSTVRDCTPEEKA